MSSDASLMHGRRSWRSRLSFVVPIVLLPALVSLTTQPVVAESNVTAVAATSVADSGPPPVQLRGSGGVLPSLIPAQSALPTGPSAGWGADPQEPEAALPREERLVQDADAGGEPGSDLPGGVRRAEALDAQSADPSAPVLVDVYPVPGYLVDSLTPSLRAWGQSSVGSSALSYSFKVCDVETMTGTGCTTSGYVAGNKNVWPVPVGKLAWAKQYWWTVTAKDPANALTSTSPKLTFTTGVRQPAVTSKLATKGADGQEFDAQSGNYTTTFTDLTVATAGPPLSVVRTFNSLDPRTDGIFGAGWSTRWDMKIAREVRGTSVSALITSPDGSQTRFRADGSGAFQPPPGMYATLAEEAGGSWRLMDKSSTVYLFDAQGRLTKVTDQRGRGQNLTYAADGKLATVSAVGGRSLTFTWSGAHVASVASDPVGGTPLVWTYVYDGNRLTQVCSPAAAPNCTLMEYGNGSQYRSSVLNSDPFGYWRLGEATGTVATGIGTSAGNATYQAVTLAQPGALTGTPDTAASFTNGSALKLPDNAIPHLADQASVETWFKTSQSGVLLAAGTTQSGGIAKGPMVYVGTDGKLRGSLDTLLTPITSTGVVNDNAWHHVVLTVSGQTQTLFLDGQQVGTMTGQVTAWRQFATIGNGVSDPAKSPAVPATTQAFPFQGVIDEVALYDKPLTAAEVAGHFAARAEVVHNLTKITLPSGRIWATNTYDGRTDRIATHTDNNGGVWKIGAVTIEPNSGEAQVIVTDPRNETLSYVYDAWRGYRLRGETDQLGHTAWYEYDQGGFLTKIIDRNNIATDIYQDKRGNTIGRKYCRAAGECAIEFWTYHLNTSDNFDPRNDQVIAHRDGRSASETDNTYAVTLEYNAFGERTKESLPATPDFPAGSSATTTYTTGDEPAIGGGSTPAGLVKTKTDPRNNAWTYRYTAAGDLAEQTSPEGLITKHGHDALGRITTRTDVSTAHPSGVSTSYTFDAIGRLITQTDPGVKNEISNVTHTARTTFVYDADGNKLSQSVSDLTGGDATRTTTFAYNGYGQLETTTDPEGGVVRQTLNSLGATATLTDQRGAVTEYGYSKRNELTTRTLKGWTGSPVNPQSPQNVVLESKGYDPGGRLTSQVDAMGRKHTYVYWTDNRLRRTIADDVKLNASTTARDVVVEALEYDPAGNRTQQVTGGGVATTDFVYDMASRLISQTLDPAVLKRKTAFTYDAAGNPTKSTLTAAGTSRIEVKELAYNSTNQVTRETIENGDTNLVSTVTYDDRGLATAVTDPRGNEPGANAADFTTTMRYDLLGRPVEAKAPQVQVDKNGTTNTARPTIRYGYDIRGGKTHVTDGEGRTVVSMLDKAGRVTGITAPTYTPPGGSAITPTISNTYDAAGQLIRSIDPHDNARSFEYDLLGRQVRVTDPAPAGQSAGQTVHEYDLLGEKLATVDPLGARVENTFDDLGRVITSTQIERKPTTAAYTTKLEYNDAGHLTKTVAPGNKVTTQTVNAAGEVTAQTDPLTHTTTLAYDLAGRLSKTTDPLGNATQVEYDLAGRQTAAKDLNTAGTVLRTFSLGYDAADNPVSSTSGEGHITRQTFDALNRQTSVIEPVSANSSITTTFGYNATGARTRLTDGRGNATWTSYNSLGLPETVTEPSTNAHPNLADRIWTSVYDAAGNETATLQPGGVRIDRTFDHLGRMTMEEGSGAGIATGEKSFGYDLAGRPTAIGQLSVDYNDRGLPLKVSNGAVQQTAYAYDALGNPTQRIDAAGTANFTWDNANRPATVKDPVTGRTLTYGYDNANRITSLTPTSGQAGTQTFTYDALDRVETHTLKNGSGTQLSKITYGWDKDDSLTSKTTAGTAGAGTNTYSYDQSRRLTSWTAPGGASTSYEWDASGNRTKAGDKTFTYDQRNRLTSGAGVDYTYTPRGTLATETKAGATRSLAFDAFDQLIADGEALYTYDALGRMNTRTKTGTEQRFAYSGLANDIAATTDAAGTIQATYGRDIAGGVLGLREGAGAAVAAMTDLHGDVVATFNATALIDSTAYDPFGEVIAQAGTKRALGYQGEYTDPDTGKVNMHSRWYQPGTGSFSSRDTWTLNPNPSVQANRYTYANASPLTGIDPTGHHAILPGGVLKEATSQGGYSAASSWNDPSDSYPCTYIINGISVASTCWKPIYINSGNSPWEYRGDRLGFRDGQLSCSMTSTGGCHMAPEVWFYERPSPGFSEEEARRVNVVAEGKGAGRDAPKGFWSDDSSAGKKARQSYSRLYDPLNPFINEERLWDAAKAAAAMTAKKCCLLGGSAGYSKDDPKKRYGPITKAELDWCNASKNMMDCAAAQIYVQQLSSFLDKKYGKGKENPERNAIRHFMGQVLMVWAFGDEFAKGIGDAHERGAGTPCHELKAGKVCDSATDQRNNETARTWAIANEKAWGKAFRSGKAMLPSTSHITAIGDLNWNGLLDNLYNVGMWMWGRHELVGAKRDQIYTCMPRHQC